MSEGLLALAACALVCALSWAVVWADDRRVERAAQEWQVEDWRRHVMQEQVVQAHLRCDEAWGANRVVLDGVWYAEDGGARDGTARIARSLVLARGQPCVPVLLLCCHHWRARRLP